MNVEQANELKSSLLWGAIVKELDRKVVFETTKLHTCTPEELPVIQATVQCYMALTRLPADVIEREQDPQA
jgi:hypothetical protein